MARISILTPIYNSESSIERSAESLFSQSLAHECEFIFVDDGSQDRSIERLKRLIITHFKSLQPQIQIISLQENRGVAEARNSALKAASGEWVIFVDADDWVEPQMVQELLSEQATSGAEVVSSDIYEVKGERQHRRSTRWIGGREGSLKELLSQSFRLPNRIWGILIRRALIAENEIRFEPRINFGEDMLFLTKLLYYAQQLAYVGRPLYHYHTETIGSYSNTMSRVNELSYIRSLHSAWEFIAQQKDAPRYQRSVEVGQLNLRRWLQLRRGATGAGNLLYRIYCWVVSRV